MEKNENKDEILNYNKDKVKIHYYYLKEFFYWDHLPDFVGENINSLAKQKVYKYENEKRTKVGRKSLENSGMIDDCYYAIEGQCEKGYIVDQTVDPDEEYDQSQPKDEILTLKTVGHILDYKKETVGEFKEILSKKSFGGYGYEYATQGDVPDNITIPDDEKILNVRVYDQVKDPRHEGTPEKYFEWKEGDAMPETSHLFFVITIADPVNPTPSTSENDNSGSYSDPSSGYDNSGNYSAPGSVYQPDLGNKSGSSVGSPFDIN